MYLKKQKRPKQKRSLHLKKKIVYSKYIVFAQGVLETIYGSRICHHAIYIYISTCLIWTIHCKHQKDLTVQQALLL